MNNKLFIQPVKEFTLHKKEKKRTKNTKMQKM